MFPVPFSPVLLILLFSVAPADAATPAVLEKIENMPATSLLMLEGNGQALIAHAQNTPRIPASTLKILTAWLAIERWGLEHRFHTDFFVDKEQGLWVKGYGDPMLVSEEIQRIAVELRSQGLASVRNIYVDESHFGRELTIDGRSASDNPYDAHAAALAANFNTLYLNKTAHGLGSAEAQTPLTDIARQLGKGLKNGKQRINLKDARLSGRYFAEILREKLRRQHVDVKGAIHSQTLAENLPLFYRHHNSNTLGKVLTAMLRYSTNFIANQIFLMLGAAQDGAPADFSKAQRYANDQVSKTFRWEGFFITEGAGLSRKNRISARQMTELLEVFRPYRLLLPAAKQGVLAKTGTLKGISCYAGYVDERPFALFINQPAPYNLRLQVVRALQQFPSASAPVR